MRDLFKSLLDDYANQIYFRFIVLYNHDCSCYFELQTLCKRKLYDLYLSFYLGQLVFYVIVLCKIAYNSINKTKEEINEIRLMLFLSEYIKKCKRDGLSYKSVSQLFVKGLVLVLIWDMMQIYYFLASLSMSDAILKSFALIFRGKLPINVLSL